MDFVNGLYPGSRAAVCDLALDHNRWPMAAAYQRFQGFFLGLIAGQVLCNGMWLVIDY